MSENTPVAAAVKILGGIEKTRKLFISPLTHKSLTRQAIYHWLANGVRADIAERLEKLTGGVITRQMLRPDIFGQPAAKRPRRSGGRKAPRVGGSGVRPSGAGAASSD